MYCSKCSKQIDANSKFCEYCGTQVVVGGYEPQPKFKKGDKVKHVSCEVFTVKDSKHNGFTFFYDVTDVDGKSIQNIPEIELSK